MRRIFILFAFLLFIIVGGHKSIFAQTVEDNLISNPSFLNGSSDSPDNWQPNHWGENDVTFNFEEQGYNDEKSVIVKINSYSSGDAKWYPEHVNVKPNTTYYFSDYYKSNIPSALVLQIVEENGHISYQGIIGFPANEEWSLAQATFTTPTKTKLLTVFHLINNVGYLQTDNYNLQELSDTAVTNGVPNNSLEDSNPSSLPLKWHENSWGNNTATFSYLNEGYSGAKCVKVELSSYTSGDAKWHFEHQPIQPGKKYTFTDFYKSNINHSVVIEYIMDDSSRTYEYIGSAGPSSDWKKFTGHFTAPINSKSFTVYHLISQIGWLITDDYSVTNYSTETFTEPLLSLTFDDATRGQYTNGLPILNKYGFPATFYIPSGLLIDPFFMNEDMVKDLSGQGYHIGSHTIDHPNLTTLSSEEVTRQLTISKTELERITGKTVSHFAAPYGAVNGDVMDKIISVYQYHRNVIPGINEKQNIDYYNLKAYVPVKTTTLEELQSWIDEAKSKNGWLILAYHQIGETQDPYSAPISDFDKHLELIKQSKIKVLDIDQVLKSYK